MLSMRQFSHSNSSYFGHTQNQYHKQKYVLIRNGELPLLAPVDPNGIVCTVGLFVSNDRQTACLGKTVGIEMSSRCYLSQVMFTLRIVFALAAFNGIKIVESSSQSGSRKHSKYIRIETFSFSKIEEFNV